MGLRTLINLPSLSLSLTSSRTLAKSRFPHGLTRSKPPPTRSSLPTTRTGTTSDVHLWLATCTCAETPELVLSVKFMEDPRTTDVLLATSTSLTETSSEIVFSPSNRSKWSKNRTSEDATSPPLDVVIWTVSLQPLPRLPLKLLLLSNNKQ